MASPLSDSSNQRLSDTKIAASFPVFWNEAVIPGFEKKYGVRVNFYDVKEDVAKQQLIAVHEADQDSPADAYFAPGPTPGTKPAQMPVDPTG